MVTFTPTIALRNISQRKQTSSMKPAHAAKTMRPTHKAPGDGPASTKSRPRRSRPRGFRFAVWTNSRIVWMTNPQTKRGKPRANQSTTPPLFDQREKVGIGMVPGQAQFTIQMTSAEKMALVM